MMLKRKNAPIIRTYDTLDYLINYSKNFNLITFYIKLFHKELCFSNIGRKRLYRSVGAEKLNITLNKMRILCESENNLRYLRDMVKSIQRFI
jgi:hypothetical protein